jgi:hypothetical protein
VFVAAGVVAPATNNWKVTDAVALHVKEAVIVRATFVVLSVNVKLVEFVPDTGSLVGLTEPDVKTPKFGVVEIALSSTNRPAAGSKLATTCADLPSAEGVTVIVFTARAVEAPRATMLSARRVPSADSFCGFPTRTRAPMTNLGLRVKGT